MGSHFRVVFLNTILIVRNIYDRDTVYNYRIQVTYIDWYRYILHGTRYKCMVQYTNICQVNNQGKLIISFFLLFNQRRLIVSFSNVRQPGSFSKFSIGLFMPQLIQSNVISQLQLKCIAKVHITGQMAPEFLAKVHNTIHTTLYILHATHYTLHTSHFKLKTTQYTLYTTHYTICNTHYKLIFFSIWYQCSK